MVELVQVQKSYGDEVVVDQVSFHVRPAESMVILGGSGSGKSTLLKLIAGLVKADSGSIRINAEDIATLTEGEMRNVRRNLGVVFQEGALFDSMTVGENVGYRMYDEGGWDEAEIREIGMQLLGFVELEHTYDLMPSELSGGMRRRVAIARALVGHPKIMLYDEPTAGLDPITSRTICDLMIKLRDLDGVASIIVTHDLNAAFFLSDFSVGIQAGGQALLEEDPDRLCFVHTEFSVLKDGKMIFTGRKADLLNSADPYVQEFLS